MKSSSGSKPAMMFSDNTCIAATKLCVGILLSHSLAGCSTPNLETTELSIGADNESVALVEGLINAYETANPEAILTLESNARDQILEDVSHGTLDGGILFYPPAGASFFSTVIASDMLVFIVNPSNAVEEISSGDVRSIFQGRIVNWSQLDAEAMVIEVATYPDGGSSRLIIDSALLLDGRINPTARLAADAGSMLLFVASTPGSIGYLPHSSLTASVRAIAIDGAAPTRENAQNRSYPYVAQIAFVSAAEPDDLLRHFLDWVLSSQGQQIVRRYALGYNE